VFLGVLSSETNSGGVWPTLVARAKFVRAITEIILRLVRAPQVVMIRVGVGPSILGNSRMGTGPRTAPKNPKGLPPKEKEGLGKRSGRPQTLIGR